MQKRIQKGNKKILLLALIITFLFMGGQILAQQTLEVEYPTIPGTDTPQDTSTPLPVYLKYFYNLSIFFTGILSFVLLVWAGLRYIVSTGKPAKRADAKGQITAAFLGIIIVFTSYLFLSTINPELIELKIGLPATSQGPAPPPPADLQWPGSEVQEMPVGTLMTSEYTASSFFFEPYTDPDCDCEKYGEAFPDLLIYPTSFQGALFGRRLKRVHEVASTTMPVADYLELLYGEFVDVMDKMMKEVDQLYSYMQECTACAGCDSGTCNGNSHCSCSCNCSGDPCLHRAEMEKLVESIPLYYDEDKNPDPPLRCKMAELEYLAKAFEPFLDNSSYLVKNEDYKDSSFYWTDEAEELRAKIESCIAAGEIEQKQYDKIEELIDLMADVENKGTYTPKTDPPERDVETNINHLEALLNAMKDVKRRINPFDQEKGYMSLMSFAEEVSWEIDQEIVPKINSYFVSFPSATEEVDVKKDPATFYAEGARISLFDIKKNDQPETTNFIFKNNIVWAQTDEPAPITPATCNHLVEIPIGKAFDEAIKLTQDILRELKNIWEKGHLITDKTLEVVEEDGLADQMFDFIDEFLELPEKIPMCEDGCDAECKTHKYTTRDEDGNIEHHCSCSCKCKPNALMLKIKAKIENKYSEIKTLEKKIKDIYDLIQEAKKSIYESFYKLNSEYPDMYPQNGEMVPHPMTNASDEDKRVPIGEDICCTDRLGNCRTKNWLIDDDKTEERDYTLKEKLVEIQKLLNRSREVISPQEEEKSVYILLIEDLIKLDLDYAEEKELRIPGTNKMDLQNCIIIYEEIEEQESEEPYKNLLNCYFAKQLYAIDPLDAEVCSPDPYLDCDFFKFTETRVKSTMSCYCYNKQAEDYSYYNQNRFPELYQGGLFLGFGNNYFCCITKYEEEYQN